ncbi:MAG: antitoxin [Roseiarcus sp.]
MTPNAKKPAEAKSTAKLFMHGRSQAVRLPKEFRFEGKEVRVSRVGDKVILEPIGKPPFDVEAWWAKLDQYLDIPFAEIPDDPPSEPDDTISFD